MLTTSIYLSFHFLQSVSLPPPSHLSILANFTQYLIKQYIDLCFVFLYYTCVSYPHFTNGREISQSKARLAMMEEALSMISTASRNRQNVRDVLPPEYLAILEDAEVGWFLGLLLLCNIWFWLLMNCRIPVLHVLIYFFTITPWGKTDQLQVKNMSNVINLQYIQH